MDSIITSYILIIFIVGIIGLVLLLNHKERMKQPPVTHNKIMRIDEIENGIGEKVFEITYIIISKGIKKKMIITDGHNLFIGIMEGEITPGSEF